MLSTELDDEQAGVIAAPPMEPLDQLPIEPEAPSAVDLLAKVQTRPPDEARVKPEDMGIHPPPPDYSLNPSNYAKAFGSAPQTGVDWKDLGQRLGMAHANNSVDAGDRTLLRASVLGGGFHPEDHSAENVAAAGEPLKLAQAQQQMAHTANADNRANDEAMRRAKADDLRAKLMKAFGDEKSAAAKTKAETDAEHLAVGDQRQEMALAETVRHNQAMEGNAANGIEARKKPKGSGGPAKVAHEGDYSSVDADIRDRVKNVVEEGGILPTGGRPGSADERVRKAVYQVAPHYQPANADAFRKLQVDVTSGRDAPAIRSLNTAIGHLADLEDVLPDTSDSQMWNKIQAQGLQAMGSTKYEAFNATRGALADELTKTYGIVNQHAVEALEKQLDNAKSKEQLSAVIKQYRHLLHSPIEAYEHQWGTLAPKGNTYEFLTPKAKAAMARDAAGGVSGKRSFKNKKTGKVITVSQAAHDKADDAEDWEAQ